MQLRRKTKIRSMKVHQNLIAGITATGYVGTKTQKNIFTCVRKKITGNVKILGSNTNKKENRRCGK